MLRAAEDNDVVSPDDANVRVAPSEEDVIYGTSEGDE
jgi:hypothetical protein